MAIVLTQGLKKQCFEAPTEPKVRRSSRLWCAKQKGYANAWPFCLVIIITATAYVRSEAKATVAKCTSCPKRSEGDGSEEYVMVRIKRRKEKKAMQRHGLFAFKLRLVKTL